MGLWVPQPKYKRKPKAKEEKNLKRTNSRI